MSTIVKFENVIKHYSLDFSRKKIVALDQLNVTIEEGKVFGLLGPNGSGKTTTIKLLLGLLRPSSGLIEVFGMSPRANQVKKKVGYLPEETYLYPFLTARETIRFYAKISGIPLKNLEARINEILNLIG
ncbi:MAG: ABC transporter ATP-binding protein, partial [Chlamydiota bacterium]|nr:ABC transporter ATP-binding protein [Chlamydiota bacterium]